MNKKKCGQISKTIFAHLTDSEWALVQKCLEKTGMSKGEYYKSAILALSKWLAMANKERIVQSEISFPAVSPVEDKNENHRSNNTLPDDAIMYTEKRTTSMIYFSRPTSNRFQWWVWKSFSITDEKEGIILSLFKDPSEGAKKIWNLSSAQKIMLGGRIIMRIIPIRLSFTELSKMLRYEILPSRHKDMLRMKLTIYK